MTHRLDYCDSSESLNLKVAKPEADIPDCRSVGNYIALGCGGLADKLALRDLNNIVLGGDGKLSVDNGCKVTAKHRVLWSNILRRGCSRRRRVNRIP